MSTRCFESFAPGRGRLTPRSALDSEAPRIDLDGAWAFRFSPALRPEPDGFEDRSSTTAPGTGCPCPR
jgi:beta-galactosidase